ncbi:hypothetical protein BC936DRAFT_137979 [Jimgerdemannia flammicorona]|uniref:Uncharacterized protein n=1 Tax=Jimgerdemannia flammicorona TaxID=994334 RepID=A0A433CW53_9FUNG|nr:hypothetical protein BC936DRAFT_137979 [Jimgerdemannia flammicorona]
MAQPSVGTFSTSTLPIVHLNTQPRHPSPNPPFSLRIIPPLFQHALPNLHILDPLPHGIDSRSEHIPRPPPTIDQPPQLPHNHTRQPFLYLVQHPALRARLADDDAGEGASQLGGIARGGRVRGP